MAPHPPYITRGVIYPGPLAGSKRAKNLALGDMNQLLAVSC